MNEDSKIDEAEFFLRRLAQAVADPQPTRYFPARS
jgi:hypothetical protein